MWDNKSPGRGNQAAAGENKQMFDANEMMQRAIEARKAKSLGLAVYGLEGRAANEPFTCYAKDAEQKAAWIAKFQADGCTVEAIA